MTTLREAVQEFITDYESGGCGHFAAYAENFRAALAQPEPRNQCGETCERAKLCAVCARGLEQAEPVLVVEKEPDYMSRGHFYEGSKPFIDPTLVWKLPIGTKLYTAPPREWRGLKEWEINDGRDQLPTEDLCNWSFRQGVYFAEKALKERNV
jgi:hypothetical protein